MVASANPTPPRTVQNVIKALQDLPAEFQDSIVSIIHVQGKRIEGETSDGEKFSQPVIGLCLSDPKTGAVRAVLGLQEAIVE